MTNRSRRVAVLGGGITGLSAAFYLLKLAEERGETVEVTVLEGSDRLGGRINTLRRDGFVIERGPDSFLARKLPMIRLAEELGLAEELTGTNPQAKMTYISRDGKLVPMPQGLVMGVPSDRDKFMQTELVSEQGKLRALQEAELPEDAKPGDESVGTFLERRMGKEMVERVFEPLLAGIHAGDLYKLGLEATFPQFKRMVEEHGSLIAGTQAAQAAAVASKARAPAGSSDSPALPVSVFLTFKNGLSTVIEAMEQRIRSDGGHIRLGAKVREIETAGSEEEPSYRLSLSDGTFCEADQVIVTLPAYAAAELLEPHTDVSALSAIRYVSVANVVFGYDAAEGFDHDLDGSGFLVPRGEKRLITASTWTSAKWQHTAPEGKRLIRCYVGRANDEQGVELNDEAMIAAVRGDLRDLMGLEAAPEFAEITRLRHSMPQYPVGHVEAIADFRAKLAQRLPGVYAAGAAFEAVGLPDCVAQGKQAAEVLLANLQVVGSDS
ncbi:protoporphyrinogen oxidase [Cohnella sp. CIP 111063]|uniref:protoporphyrinogen oxidase n=1 Tax=unclassified Cohnella TaxID=2636738 RepID=UPI000B8C335F|nr:MULTISPECIES: protoporphyrinogen oxidase [unclassified Cohnella]OXS62623.1 protoporphyrinogen oxidase [Cohnella sp. CIP 111063]PRX74882.1 protoporphyrinogen oxidase [Cohnella sp. SGD-V74]